MRLGEMMHATPLRRASIWGKLLGPHGSSGYRMHMLFPSYSNFRQCRGGGIRGRSTSELPGRCWYEGSPALVLLGFSSTWASAHGSERVPVTVPVLLFCGFFLGMEPTWLDPRITGLDLRDPALPLAKRDGSSSPGARFYNGPGRVRSPSCFPLAFSTRLIGCPGP